MSKTAPTVAVDLVQEFLESSAVAQMLGYAAQAGPNQVSLACHDLRHGRAVIIDSALLPPEISVEFHDTVRLTSVRLRLQRDHAPEIMDDRAPVDVQEDDVEDDDTLGVTT
ncbi:hypothetical protein [Dietzia cinnamea]|uniref:hypothetical protein n=1 Tax=Dietzia cinnamea TaxID=321318 RepID=UPI0021A5B1EF|nr:hypothetical protein [Dietzia cinnamea]MCT1639742.1 hypothetical protein [Dietzia cinnamea]